MSTVEVQETQAPVAGPVPRNPAWSVGQWKAVQGPVGGGRWLLRWVLRAPVRPRPEGECLTSGHQAFEPAGARDPSPGVRPASRPCVRLGQCRQPDSSGPGNCRCGGARVKGLKSGVAASARRARRSRISSITAGFSMLAITFTAPPQCSQVSTSASSRQGSAPRSLCEQYTARRGRGRPRSGRVRVAAEWRRAD